MPSGWIGPRQSEAAQKRPPRRTKELKVFFVPFGGSLDLAGHPFNELDFFRNVRSAVVAKHFVKPDRRFAIDIRMLPRIPRQVRLCLTLDQSPVNHADVMNVADHQTTKEEA